MQHMNQEKDEAAKYLCLKIVATAILLVNVRMSDRNCNYKFTVFHTLDLLKTNFFITQTKSHTCEECGAHLRISFWHSLMNLKNK